MNGTHLAYFADDNLGPQSLITFDVDTRRREVLLEGPTLLIEPAVSGDRVAFYGQSGFSTGLWTVDSTTGDFAIVTDLYAERRLPPTFSPDGEWLAFVATNVYSDIYSPRTSVGPSRGSDLWVVSEDGQAPRLITVDLNVESNIFWTDGGLVFTAVDKAQSRTRTAIYRVQPDGLGLIQLTSTDLDAIPTDVSPDGKWILAVARSSTGDDGEMTLLRISMHGTTVEEIHAPVNQMRDAQWLAPIEFDWNSIVVLLTGLVSGGGYVAYRRVV